ncbi:MAG: GxxExxY protein [Terriglobia bacterium]|jgi:hypothetical protein
MNTDQETGQAEKARARIGVMKHKETTEKIIGIFYDVYNQLGQGFLESV